MIVAWDINSYPQPLIDHNGGSSCVRLESVSSHLLALGFCDTFRNRFPTMTAFTHISKSGGSRLDQICVRSAAGTQLDTVNASIIWDWPHQTDHTPVIGDFLFTIPTVQDK